MGNHCSIHNDTTDETVMVFVGVNTKVLQPMLYALTGAATLLSGGVALGSVSPTLAIMSGGEIAVATATAAAGGFVSASNFCLDRYCRSLVNDLTKGGYETILPGQTYNTTLRMLTPGLNLRAWLVRIKMHKTMHNKNSRLEIKRCSGSIWTAMKPGEGKVYRVMDKTVFRTWTKHYETIPMMPSSYQSDDGHDEAGEKDVEEFFDAMDIVSTVAADDLQRHDARCTTKRAREESSAFSSEEVCTVEQDVADEATYTFLKTNRANAQCKTVIVKEHVHQHDDDAWIQIE